MHNGQLLPNFHRPKDALIMAVDVEVSKFEAIEHVKSVRLRGF